MNCEVTATSGRSMRRANSEPISWDSARVEPQALAVEAQ